MSASFPAEGRLAGIDYGHVRVGIAVCDLRRTLASPLATYTRRNPAADAEFFCRLAEEKQVVGFVVGLPVHASAAESAKSREAREFGEWLSRATGRPVCFHDERYTTLEAKRLLSGSDMRKKRRKMRLDMLAAQIILAAFLESSEAAGRPPQPLDDPSGSDLLNARDSDNPGDRLHS